MAGSESGVGSFKCEDRRSQVCLNVTETETFTVMEVPLFTY